MIIITKHGFTLVELIVSVTILIILSTVWFVSYMSNISDARDSERKSHISEISSALKLYKQKRWWIYPYPWDSFNIINNTTVVAMQWLLNNNVSLSTLDNVPLDPYIEIPYHYSTTKNRQEFQIALSLENQETNLALLNWDFKTVSVNVLPTIMLAIDSSTDVEIHDWVWAWSTNRTKFIFSNWLNNLPYTFEWSYPPYNRIWVTFAWLLEDPNKIFWQNSDYRTCDEIYESWKWIHYWYSEEYQLLSNTWVLFSSWCTY